MDNDSIYYTYNNGVNEMSLMDLVHRCIASSSRFPDSHLRTHDSACEREAINARSYFDVDVIHETFLSAHKHVMGYSKRIVRVSIGGVQGLKIVQIVNSEGVQSLDQKNLNLCRVEILAQQGARVERGMAEVGSSKETIFTVDEVAEIGREAAHQALTLLESSAPPYGEMPVVLSSGQGGYLIHEASGHALEADHVSSGMSVLGDKMGQKVGSEILTVIDDGTLPLKLGSATVDDEGTRTQSTVLISHGILKHLIHDLLSAKMTKCEPTGNGRRQSFRFPPLPRMTNTYVAPGDSSPEEIIASTEKGLFVKSLSGGQVNPATGKFAFGAREAYLIEKGKIGRPVRGPTLIGDSMQVLRDIDMIGNDLKFAIALCGKKGQYVYVTLGQPTLRIKSLLVIGNRE